MKSRTAKSPGEGILLVASGCLFPPIAKYPSSLVGVGRRGWAETRQEMGLNSLTQVSVTSCLVSLLAGIMLKSHIKISSRRTVPDYRKESFQGFTCKGQPAPLTPVFQSLTWTLSEAPPQDPFSSIQNNRSKRHYGATGFKLVFLIANNENNINTVASVITCKALC